jgi:hypothetical protein
MNDYFKQVAQTTFIVEHAINLFKGKVKNLLLISRKKNCQFLKNFPNIVLSENTLMIIYVQDDKPEERAIKIEKKIKKQEKRLMMNYNTYIVSSTHVYEWTLSMSQMIDAISDSKNGSKIVIYSKDHDFQVMGYLACCHSKIVESSFLITESMICSDKFFANDVKSKHVSNLETSFYYCTGLTAKSELVDAGLLEEVLKETFRDLRITFTYYIEKGSDSKNAYIRIVKNSGSSFTGDDEANFRLHDGLLKLPQNERNYLPVLQKIYAEVTARKGVAYSFLIVLDEPLKK